MLCFLLVSIIPKEVCLDQVFCAANIHRSPQNILTVVTVFRNVIYMHIHFTLESKQVEMWIRKPKPTKHKQSVTPVSEQFCLRKHPCVLTVEIRTSVMLLYYWHSSPVQVSTCIYILYFSPCYCGSPLLISTWNVTQAANHYQVHELRNRNLLLRKTFTGF
jgi:hypothetical protein